MADQYLPEELEKVVGLLEAWATCKRSPPDKWSGICYNLTVAQELPEITTSEGEALVAEAAKTWPEFSGHSLFPVPHPDLSPESAYTTVREVAKWSGEYGAARRRLCQHIADYIRANPTKALRILHWR